MRTACLLVLLAAGCGGSSEQPPAAAPASPAPAAPASRAGAEAMCTLLTQAEAEAILGKTPATPEPQANGSCAYAGGEILLALLPKDFNSPGEFSAFAQQEVKRTNERAKMNMMTYEVVPLGDAAFYDSFSLHVLKGRHALTIVAYKPIALKVAEKALPRWK